MNLSNVEYKVDDVVIHSTTTGNQVKDLENVLALLLKRGNRFISHKHCLSNLAFDEHDE